MKSSVRRECPGKWLGRLAVVLLLLAGAAAWAEESDVPGDVQVAVAKAAGFLDAGEPLRALDVIEGAEREAGATAVLSYYRGLANLELGRHEEAAAAFRRAREQAPDMFEAKLMLGVLLHKTGDYRQAAAVLGEAVEQKPDDAAALYWAGLTARRLGDERRAEELFSRSAEIDPSLAGSGVTSRYGLSAAGAGSRFRFKGWVGIGYDDNVILEADDTGGGTDEDDLVGSAAVLGSYRLGEGRSGAVDVYYGAYVTGHESLSDYDVQHHRVGVETEISLGGPALVVDVGLEYTLVGGHTYRTAAELSPAVRISGQGWQGLVSLSARTEHYFASDVTVRNEERTGNRYRAGYRHEWVLGNGILVAGDAGYVVRDARAEERGQEGFDLSLEGDVPLTDRWSIDGLARYEFRDFDDGRSWPGGRQDDMVDLGAGVGYRFGERWAVRLDYRYHRTDSDVDGYSYTQNVVRMSLGVEL